MRYSLFVLCLVSMLGCSLVNSPSDHQDPAVDAGDGDDAGADAAADGTPPSDSGNDVPMVDAGNDVPSTDAGDDVPIVDAGEDAPLFDGGPEFPTGPGVDFCVEYAELVCTGHRDCCEPRPGADPFCVADRVTECLAYYGPGMPDFLTFDQTVANDQLERLRGIVDGCTLELPRWGAEGFFLPLTGDRAPAADCRPEGGLVPTAEQVIEAARSCGEDTICHPGAALLTWSCGERRSNASPCQFGFQCTSNRCNKTDVLMQGTCGVGLDPGIDCDGRPDVCASLICDGTGAGSECAELTPENVWCR